MVFRGAVSAMALIAGGCSLPPVDLGGRACPCAAEWHCDLPSNVCLPGAPEAGGPGEDGGPGFDAGPGDDGGPGADGGRGEDAGPGVDAGPRPDGGPPAGYRRTLTVSAASVSGTHAGFPLLVTVESDASLAAHARTDASDLRFTASDGTLLPHEIESWEAATGALVAWVRVPELSDASDTVVRLRYGETSPAAALPESMVWSSGFAGVWHLDEAPAGSAGEVYDSTAAAHHGTSSPASARPTSAAGRIGRGYAFDAPSRQRVVFEDSADWVLTSRPATISLWLRADVTQPGGDYPRVVERFEGGVPGTGYTLMLTPSRNLSFNHRDDDTGSDAAVAAGTAVNDATWHYVVVTLDGSTARFYLDGTVRESDPYSNLLDLADPLRLGVADSSGNQAFAGRMDEVRVHHVARSAGWVLTEHRNQSDAATFVTVGPEEAL